MARTRVRGICCGIGYLQCSARNSMPTLFRSHGFSHRQAISSSIWYPEQWCRARRIRAARGRLVFRSRSCSGGWGCDARSEDRARSRGARACPPVFSETAISASSSAACLLGRHGRGRRLRRPLDIRDRSGERFAQLLRVGCALRLTEICNLDQQPIQQIGNAYIFRMPGSQGRDLPPHLAEIERLVFRRPLQNDTRAGPAHEADAPSMMARGLAGVNPDGAMSGEQT
jgi:hypothetical protein